MNTEEKQKFFDFMCSKKFSSFEDIIDAFPQYGNDDLIFLICEWVKKYKMPNTSEDKD